MGGQGGVGSGPSPGTLLLDSLSAIDSWVLVLVLVLELATTPVLLGRDGVALPRRGVDGAAVEDGA